MQYLDLFSTNITTKGIVHMLMVTVLRISFSDQSKISSLQYEFWNINFVLQDWTVQFWQSQGVHNNKLILGIATYGMSFTLHNPQRNRPGAPAIGGGRRGKYTREKGILSFYEVSVLYTVIWNYDCMISVYWDNLKSPF